MTDFIPPKSCRNNTDCWRNGACTYNCHLYSGGEDLPLFSGKPASEVITVEDAEKQAYKPTDTWSGLQTTDFGVNGEFAHLKITIKSISFTDDKARCKCICLFTFKDVKNCPTYFVTGYGITVTDALRAAMRAITRNEHKADKFGR